MIRSIRHKGLKRLHEDDDPRGVMREHAEKLRDILARLDAAGTVADMDVPGFRLHPLKGELQRFLGGDGSRELAGDLSALPTATRWTLIMSITTERRLNHADEESTPPRRLCAAPVH